MSGCGCHKQNHSIPVLANIQYDTKYTRGGCKSCVRPVVNSGEYIRIINIPEFYTGKGKKGDYSILKNTWSRQNFYQS